MLATNNPGPQNLLDRWRGAVSQLPQMVLFTAAAALFWQGCQQMSGANPHFGAVLISGSVVLVEVATFLWLHLNDLLPKSGKPRIIVALISLAIVSSVVGYTWVEANSTFINSLIGPERIKVTALPPDEFKVFPLEFEINGNQQIRNASVICSSEKVTYGHLVNGKLTGIHTDSAKRESVKFLGRLENTKYVCPNPLPDLKFGPDDKSRILGALVGFIFEFSVPEITGDRLYVSSFYRLVDESKDGMSRLRWDQVGGNRGYVKKKD